jgi:hypothetical protein
MSQDVSNAGQQALGQQAVACKGRSIRLAEADAAGRYRYVATLEDDLAPAVDFLEFHEHLWPLVEADPSAAALLAYPNGPAHDCRCIADKLQVPSPRVGFCATTTPEWRWP